MKTIAKPLFILLLFCIDSTFPGITYAQQTVKTISGIFTGDLEDPDWKILSVSTDGNRVSLGGHDAFITLLINEQRLIKISSPYTRRLSPDHRYTFINFPDHIKSRPQVNFNTLAPEPDPKKWASIISHPEDRVPLKIFRDTNFILAITPSNQLILSSAWKDSERLYGSNLRGLRGLWLADLSGNLIKVLRTDTLVNTNQGGWHYLPSIGFNSTYTALISEDTKDNVIIYPFGSGEVIKTNAKTGYREYMLADAKNLYEQNADGSLSIYSLSDGKLLNKAVYRATLSNEYVYRRCLFALGQNDHLFRFDREKAMVYEEEFADGALHILQSWSLPPGIDMKLVANQRYTMAVCAGPSLLIVPRYRRDGMVPGNEGFVIDLTTGNITMRIAPFFNPSAEQLIIEARIEKNRIKENELKKLKNIEDCNKKLTALGLAFGNGVEGQGRSGVLRGYDCIKDEFAIWLPKSQLKYYEQSIINLDGATFRTSWQKSNSTWATCSTCAGKGSTSKVIEQGYTKEVPQGYFSGIKTTVTKTWNETVHVTCTVCKGDGVVK